MPLVVDTNQAGLLPTDRQRDWVLALSPYVMAEIMLGRTRTLRRLSTFPFKRGLELLDVWIQLSRYSPKEIREFEPFVRPGQQYRQDYDVMVSAMDRVRPTHVEWAKYIKQSHRQYMATLSESAITFRRRLREHGLSKVKHSTFAEALSEYASDSESFLGDAVVGTINYGGRRATETRPDKLFKAVMENQYVGRFFHAILAYILSISHVWKDQKLNQNPSPKRDDMTDITLLLYAADGDLILSNDNYLSRLVSLIEPKGNVKVCKVEDII